MHAGTTDAGTLASSLSGYVCPAAVVPRRPKPPLSVLLQAPRVVLALALQAMSPAEREEYQAGFQMVQDAAAEMRGEGATSG